MEWPQQLLEYASDSAIDAGRRRRAEHRDDVGLARAVVTVLESYRRPLPKGGFGAAGVLGRQVEELTDIKDKRLAALHQQAADHLAGVLLPWLGAAAKEAGTLFVPGGPNGTTAVDAAALVAALAALPDRGVALPVVPEVLVTPDRAALGPFSADDPAVGSLRAGALDLHRLDEWGDVDAPVPQQGIDLGRIADQLADATVADLALLAGLRELADLVRQELRTALRSSQAAAAIAEREELAAQADAVAKRLRHAADDPGTATAEVARDLIEGVRIMTDATSNDTRRQDHAERGLLLRPDNSRLAITRVFNARAGADIVARFKETGSCWFEIQVQSLPKAADGARRYHEVVAAGVSVRLIGAKRLENANLVVRHSGRGVLALIGDGRIVDQLLSPETVSLAMRGEPGSMFGVAPTPDTPEFTLAGRAIAAQWSLHLPDGAADLDGLTAIEVQVDLEAFVPADAITLRRITHPVETMVPGSTAKATVELTAAAPAGGVPVILTTTHPEIAEPHSVTVPAGAASAQFDVDVKAPTGVSHVVLTARTLDGASARVVLGIPMPPFERVQRTTVPEALPVRTIATVRDRTFAIIDPPAVAPRSIVAFDKTMAPVGQAIAGIGCRHVVADETRNRLYVVNGGDGKSGAGVRMLDATTLQALTEWPTSDGVAFAATDPGAGLVYVSHWVGRRVFVLDADDLTQVDTIGDADFTGLLGMAVDPALGRIYVARTYRAGPPGSEVGALSVIERRPDGSHGIGPTILIGVAVQPYQVAVDPKLGLIYVLGLGGGPEAAQLVVLDRTRLAENARIRTISGVTPDRTLATREGTGIVHTSGYGGIQVIDVNAGAAVGMIAAEGAGSVVALGTDHIVGATTLGELVRVAAPQQITTTEWR
jgi:DNA-binding beta-propeller fold protein YncE